MILTTYEMFSNAIKNKAIRDAETIFASSDVRCELISKSMINNDKNTVEQMLSLFRSKGLREQALSICSNCTHANCSLKQNLSNTVQHYTSEENKLTNLKQRTIQIDKNKMFEFKVNSLTTQK